MKRHLIKFTNKNWWNSGATRASGNKGGRGFNRIRPTLAFSRRAGRGLTSLGLEAGGGGWQGRRAAVLSKERRGGARLAGPAEPSIRPAAPRAPTGSSLSGIPEEAPRVEPEGAAEAPGPLERASWAAAAVPFREAPSAAPAAQSDSLPPSARPRLGQSRR